MSEKYEYTYWELGHTISEEEGTETIESFNSLECALHALFVCNSESAFIDCWCESQTNPIGVSIYKKDLLSIFNGTYVNDEDQGSDMFAGKLYS